MTTNPAKPCRPARRAWRRVGRPLACVAACLGAAGCAEYAAVQADLIAQAERGVDLAGRSLSAKSDLIEAEHAARRARLDRAFDADVRERRDLSPEWVIESRRAYAAAVDALNDRRDVELANDAVDRKNIAAAKDALGTLRRLQLPPTAKPQAAGD